MLLIINFYQSLRSTYTYLIFVIFFTQAKFLENEIYTEKRVNYDKLNSKLPILSLKIFTSQKKFTRAPPVAPVTNMRYAVIS